MRVILFNLYPYRILRENKRRRRVMLELGAGLLFGLVFCVFLSQEFAARVAGKEQFLGNLSAMDADMSNRAQEVQAMKERVTVLSRQVEALQAVEEESLLASRWVSFLDATVPPRVSLSRLHVENGVLHLNGFTDTVASLAKWVDQMETGNALFTSVDLVTLVEPNRDGKSEVDQNHMFEIKALLREGGDAL